MSEVSPSKGCSTAYARASLSERSLVAHFPRVFFLLFSLSVVAVLQKQIWLCSPQICAGACLCFIPLKNVLFFSVWIKHDSNIIIPLPLPAMLSKFCRRIMLNTAGKDSKAVLALVETLSNKFRVFLCGNLGLSSLYLVRCCAF